MDSGSTLQKAPPLTSKQWGEVVPQATSVVVAEKLGRGQAGCGQAWSQTAFALVEGDMGKAS